MTIIFDLHNNPLRTWNYSKYRNGIKSIKTYKSSHNPPSLFHILYTCCARVPRGKFSLRVSIPFPRIPRIWLVSATYTEHRLIELEKENYTRGCPRQRRTEHGLFLRGNRFDLHATIPTCASLSLSSLSLFFSLSRREARDWSKQFYMAKVNARLIVAKRCIE